MCACGELSYCTDNFKICKCQEHKMAIRPKEIVFLDSK